MHFFPAETCPSVLWCLYFNIADGSGLEAKGHDLPSNVHMCSGPDGDLSHENAIKQVKGMSRLPHHRNHLL